MSNSKPTPKPNHILVAVITSGGSVPSEGHAEIPIHQPISVELEKAKTELKLASVDGWVAKVDGRVLNVSASYEANGLGNQVDIQWGPREGGGGVRR